MCIKEGYTICRGCCYFVKCNSCSADIAVNGRTQFALDDEYQEHSPCQLYSTKCSLCRGSGILGYFDNVNGGTGEHLGKVAVFCHCKHGEEMYIEEHGGLGFYDAIPHNVYFDGME